MTRTMSIILSDFAMDLSGLDLLIPQIKREHRLRVNQAGIHSIEVLIGHLEYS